jgi:hypothetical protein
LANGSQTALSLNFQGDTTTGLFLAAAGQLGLVTGGVLAALLTATGLKVPVGIVSGTF